MTRLNAYIHPVLVVSGTQQHSINNIINLRGLIELDKSFSEHLCQANISMLPACWSSMVLSHSKLSQDRH